MAQRPIDHRRNKPRVIAITTAAHRQDVVWLGLILILAFAMIVLVTATQTRAQSRSLETNSSNLLNTENLSTWTDSNCGNCHTQGSQSHPVNILAPMGVPEGLPLENGKITCVTCHDNTSSELHMQARLNHTPMLRDLGGISLCYECHDPAASIHGAKLGRAHFTSMASSMSFGGSSTIETGTTGSLISSEIDAISRDCLTCHDGSVAKDVSTGARNPSRVPGSLIGSRADHSLGVYPMDGMSSNPNDEMRRYVMPTALDSRINLVDGKVSCVSCHNPYSSVQKQMVMPDYKQNLCQTCHLGTN